jgi:hypothetical protein
MPSLPAETVQREITKAGLQWEARESRISELAEMSGLGACSG